MQQGDNKQISVNTTPTASVVDGAVGVEAAHWYVAVVNCRSEKATAQRLASLGIDNYLPTQEEVHVWANGRKKRVERVMIPARIFIRCTEAERREVVKLPFILRFLTDPATARAGRMAPARVPAHEIAQLRFMLGATDAPVAFAETYAEGQRVRVVRGPFRGLEGIVTGAAATLRLHINIDFLGSASVSISPSDLTPA